MKFESKFGVGEICGYGEYLVARGGQDQLVKVVAVTFGLDGCVEYMVELSNHIGIGRISITEKQLNGDPDFDQDAGRYPSEVNTNPDAPHESKV